MFYGKSVICKLDEMSAGGDGGGVSGHTKTYHKVIYTDCCVVCFYSSAKYHRHQTEFGAARLNKKLCEKIKFLAQSRF
jgi:hypothetical protein